MGVLERDLAEEIEERRTEHERALDVMTALATEWFETRVRGEDTTTAHNRWRAAQAEVRRTERRLRRSLKKAER